MTGAKEEPIRAGQLDAGFLRSLYWPGFGSPTWRSPPAARADRAS